MVKFIGEDMIVDTPRADGGAYFKEDCFEWKARDIKESKYNVTIRYEDIKSVTIIQGIKKRVDVVTNDNKIHYFYLYKANTFVELIEAGREHAKMKKEEGFAPLSDEDLDRLAKLSQLHKDDILTDDEFNLQKNEIMKKYRR